MKERGQLGQNVFKSERLFNMITKNILEVFWVTDVPFTRILYISPGYELIWEKTCRSLYEHPESFLKSIHSEDLERVVHSLSKEGGGAPFDHEYRIIMPDGRLKWIWDRGFPIIEDDQPTIFVGIAQDITERKQIEETLQKAKAEADVASRAKSEFLANMSHEIRTPMNAIIGMAEILHEGNLNQDQKRCLETIRAAGENLLDIINGILDISKIEAGQYELDLICFDLQAMMETTYDIMSFRARKKGLEITSRIADDVSNNLIGDSARLRQVLINLLGNAIKFTSAGEIQIEIKNQKTDGDQVELLFSVRDSGIGIAPDKLEKIFERFVQADHSTTRKYGGTGLGLTISRNIIERMGGKIWVVSEEGKGSVFYFTVSFKLNDECKYNDEPKEPEVKREATNKNLSILLVEDNEDNSEIISLYLQSTGYKIDLAINGSEALDRFKLIKYNLILMDMEMPVMDGLTATKEIRKLEEEKNLSRIPIVALTAHASKEHREKSLAAGCDGHLIKPISKQVLLEAITKFT
jgi:PAS domain S-box-containing protein